MKHHACVLEALHHEWGRSEVMGVEQMRRMAMRMSEWPGPSETAATMLSDGLSSDTGISLVPKLCEPTSAKQPFLATGPTVATLVHNSVQSGQTGHIWTALQNFGYRAHSPHPCPQICTV